MNVEIDKNSGFCFGVVYAIERAEEELAVEKELYCIGDIVHNNVEVERLKKKGLKIIDHEQYKTLKDCKVLIRAHGEPPETYKIALQNNIKLIDASCPVVLKLQKNIKNGYEQSQKSNGQVVIFGKKGHAEVNGLVGQTLGNAIVVSKPEDLELIDYTKPVSLFSQTTMEKKEYAFLKDEIEKRLIQNNNHAEEVNIKMHRTICSQVSGREPDLRIFAQKHNVIIFVSGKKSSNGKVLYDICKEENQRSYFVSELPEIKKEWFTSCPSVGISGATSTPAWLIEEVKKHILEL